jgi:hypothetical protein
VLALYWQNKILFSRKSNLDLK